MHQLYNCRYKKEEDKGELFICLKPNHQSSDCPVGIKCHYCKQVKQHHRSLCPKQFGSVNREYSSLSEEIPTQEDVVNTENSFISLGEMVLMQTAKTQIKKF